MCMRMGVVQKHLCRAKKNLSLEDPNEIRVEWSMTDEWVWERSILVVTRPKVKIDRPRLSSFIDSITYAFRSCNEILVTAIIISCQILSKLNKTHSIRTVLSLVLLLWLILIFFFFFFLLLRSVDLKRTIMFKWEASFERIQLLTVTHWQKEKQIHNRDEVVSQEQ